MPPMILGKKRLESLGPSRSVSHSYQPSGGITLRRAASSTKGFPGQPESSDWWAMGVNFSPLSTAWDTESCPGSEALGS